MNLFLKNKDIFTICAYTHTYTHADAIDIHENIIVSITQYGGLQYKNYSRTKLPPTWCYCSLI